MEVTKCYKIVLNRFLQKKMLSTLGIDVGVYAERRSEDCHFVLTHEYFRLEVIEEIVHNRSNKAVFKVGRELVKRRINISRMGYS